MSDTNNPIDEFAAIGAMGASGNRANELVAQNPPNLPDKQLLSESGSRWAFVPAARVCTQNQVENEVAALREKMAAFLEEHSPKLATNRRILPLASFDWQMVPPERESGFADALLGKGDGWKTVKIPHYGPPTGRALAWYRTEFQWDETSHDNTSQWVCFEGADYRARVYLNGRCVGEHEGFFAPFEFEITRSIRTGVNCLFVELFNDGICKGYEDDPSGDKLYAATGIGWDEPGSGWHHCPPGMGIHRPVKIESRADLFIRDVWVRPLLAEEAVEVRAEIYNATKSERPISLEIAIHGLNFSEADKARLQPVVPSAGLGSNFYHLRLPMPQAKLWTTHQPWLYQAQITLRENTVTLDAAASTFGMRSFLMNQEIKPYGNFTLNGEPIRLRGANTMGFEQLRVAAEDREGLIHDLLLAKVAHMNFLRFTQRPVEREIHELCDRLGIMTQTDLPLFAYLRRTQFAEAVRQSIEMARHVRSHASSILLSYINEPFPAAWGDNSHRCLTRPELEGFFASATEALRVENPDVVIKPVDGDYDPPSPSGLPDSHIYSLWYNGHGLPFGDLHRGSFPRVKKDWHYGCGEYGAEGLDPLDLMQRLYPKDWLPAADEDEKKWTPSRISHAQSGEMFYFFYDRPQSPAKWVKASQEHQRWATQMLTEAFRRDIRLVSCAIHLFIDAWPAGWMKSIVDCERTVKPAYLALRDAYTPLLVSLRSDRLTAQSGEVMKTELWICNDEPQTMSETTVRWQLEDEDGVVLESGSAPAQVAVCAPEFQGHIVWHAQKVSRRTKYQLCAGLFDSQGALLADSVLQQEVFPEIVPVFEPVTLLDEPGSPAGRLLTDWQGELPAQNNVPDASTSHAIASRWPVDPEEISLWLNWVFAGGKLVLLELPIGEYKILDADISVCAMGFSPAIFVSRATNHELVSEMQPRDFFCWHNEVKGQISPLLASTFTTPPPWNPILVTGYSDWGKKRSSALAAAERSYGQGQIVICQVLLAGRIKTNPAAAHFVGKLLTSLDEVSSKSATNKHSQQELASVETAN